jgi:CRISPR-associated protein Csa3
VATLGFDADLVLRRVRQGGYGRIKCLALRVDDASFRRVENAFATVEFVADRLSVPAELRAFEPGRGLVRGVLAELESELARGADEVELYLSGGPRLLVVAALIASLLVHPSFADRVRVVVEGEGFEASLEAPAGWLKRLASLTSEEVEVLNYVAGVGRARPPELARDLGLPKATAYKRLRKLAEEGLLAQEGDYYTVSKTLHDALY